MDIISLIEKLEKELPKNINPRPENVLRFLYVDLNNVKCIFEGQDPYPALPKNIDLPTFG